MNLNRLAQINGVPGCGKDYVTGLLAAGDRKRKYFCFSDVMLKTANEMGMEIDRNGLESLDRSKRDDIVKRSLSHILDNQPVIVNMHNVYRVSNGLVEVNYAFESILLPRLYIHVTSPVEQIIARIRKDVFRGRFRNYTSYEIELMQRLSISVTKFFADSLNAAFLLFDNIEGGFNVSLEKARGAIEALL